MVAAQCFAIDINELCTMSTPPSSVSLIGFAVSTDVLTKLTKTKKMHYVLTALTKYWGAR